MKSDSQRIAQIGLGLLGGAIAQRLLQQKSSILGFDLDSKRCREFAANGGTVAANAGEVFRESPLVIVSLPRSEDVAALIDQYACDLSAGQIVIDTTTGDPDEVVAIGHFLKQHNVDYLEATVAGSSRLMRQGLATMFLGGDDDVLAKTRPYVRALSERHFHLGPAGSASRFKLVHNLFLGLHRAVLAEGLAFAEALGFSPKQALDILRHTPAASTVMETKGEKMVNRDWKPEAKLSQHLKDVRLILELAEKNFVPTPLSGVHRDLLEQTEQLGFGEADNTAILEAYRERPA